MVISTYQAILLHAKAYRILRVDLSKMLKPFHISLPEWSTIEIIAKTPRIRGTELAHELGVEIPMVTMLLKQLEEKEYILRSATTGDKRSRTIVLTETGTALVHNVDLALRSQLPEYFQDIPVDDMRAHVRVLEKIIVNHSS